MIHKNNEKVICNKFLDFYCATQYVMSNRSTSDWLRILDKLELDYIDFAISKFEGNNFDINGVIESDIVMLCYLLYYYELGLDVEKLYHNIDDEFYVDGIFTNIDDKFSNLCILVSCETLRRNNFIDITGKLKISSLSNCDSYIQLTENGKNALKELRDGNNILCQIVKLMELKN